METRPTVVTDDQCCASSWLSEPNNYLRTGLEVRTQMTERSLSEKQKSALNIGLALSGGGFRATLFHLGLIRFLRDAGLLASVKHLASVSGGSIIAAHLIYRWRDYTSPDDADFEKAASELIAFTQQDVRGKIVRRLPLLLLASLVPKVKFGRTDLLEQFYDKFYDYTTLHGLRVRNPDAPALHILTTNLSSGQLCSFTSEGFCIDTPQGTELYETYAISTALAVTASSSYPLFFPPIELTAERLQVDMAAFQSPFSYVTDGGIFDNLGARKLALLDRDVEFDHVVISDAGATFDPNYTKRFRSLLNAASRSTDILMKRVGELEYERVQEQNIFSEELLKDEHRLSRFRFAKLATEVHPHEDNEALHLNVQRAAKSIRTDLDKFSDMEVRTLVAHGYCVARYVLQDLWSKTQPDLADKPLWIPECVAEESGEAEKNVGAEHKKSVATAKRLLDSNRVHPHFFSLRDPWGILNLTLAIAFVYLLGSVFLNTFDYFLAWPDSYRMRIVYDDYLPQWEQSMLSSEQRAAVDEYQETGEMPVEAGLMRAVQDFRRQENVVGRVGRGKASLRVRDNFVHGTAFFRFPGEFRRVVFLMSGDSRYVGNEQKLDVTFKQFDRGQNGNHTRHPTARFEVELTRTENGYKGDFFHPKSREVKLGEMSLTKSWSSIGYLLKIWLSL
ncbi:MAG: patatin-like phospholipase family protein [Methyloceanibacter sp.]|nr:patatin-like phospholipase family protein [Methyloceanibacter sp.]